MDGARLIYFMIAGVDFIPLGELPGGVCGGGCNRRRAETREAIAEIEYSSSENGFVNVLLDDLQLVARAKVGAGQRHSAPESGVARSCRAARPRRGFGP